MKENISLNANGFESLSHDEMMAVDGGGIVGSVFDSIVSVVSGLGNTPQGPVLSAITSITIKVAAIGSYICSLFGW